MSLFEAGIVAFAVCPVTGLPGDWARRQAFGAIETVMVMVTVAVTARVLCTPGRGVRPSPGNGSLASSAVAPHRWW